jgi:hypothetical protein
MSDPPITRETDLSVLFDTMRKDTTNWATVLQDQGFDLVEDLLEMQVEELQEILDAGGADCNKGKLTALRSALKNASALNLPPNWTFLSRSDNEITHNVSGLTHSNSVGSGTSAKCTKALFVREPHSGCKSDIIPAVISAFARLLGFLALADSDLNTICYLMAIYHGLALSMTPLGFEYKGMALALARLFRAQTEAQKICWKTKLRSMFKNMRQGCYPKENPFPRHPLWDRFLASKLPLSLCDCVVTDATIWCRCAHWERSCDKIAKVPAHPLHRDHFNGAWRVSNGILAANGSGC